MEVPVVTYVPTTFRNRKVCMHGIVFKYISPL